jgi:hypothetical protein
MRIQVRTGPEGTACGASGRRLAGVPPGKSARPAAAYPAAGAAPASRWPARLQAPGGPAAGAWRRPADLDGALRVTCDMAQLEHMYEHRVKGPPLEYTFGPTIHGASGLTRADPARDDPGRPGRRSGPQNGGLTAPSSSIRWPRRAARRGGPGTGFPTANGRPRRPAPGTPRPVRQGHPRPVGQGRRGPSARPVRRPPGWSPSPARPAAPGDRSPWRAPLGWFRERPPTLISSRPAWAGRCGRWPLSGANAPGRAALALWHGRAGRGWSSDG